MTIARTSNVSGAVARCFARPIAHRGLHACGCPGPIENSIGAALGAIRAGYGIECDVQLSKDGEAIVFHDDRLGRLTALSEGVRDFHSYDLSKVALGKTIDTIPTLPSFLAAIDGRVPLIIEIKQGPPGDFRLADRVMALIRSYSGDVVIECFDPAIVSRCREAPCPVGLVGPSDTSEVSDPSTLERCDFVSWSIDHVASIALRHPTMPRTTWTVRTQAQRELAKAHQSQIVFEGFDPKTVS